MATRTTRSSNSTQQSQRRRWQFLRFSPGVNYQRVNRALLNRLNRLGEALGQVITVTSGYRSYQEQARLYYKYQHGGNIAAPPGRSMHEKGLAVDAVIGGTPLSQAVKAQTLRQYGLAAPVKGDPVHIQLLGGGNVGQSSYAGYINAHPALKPYAGQIQRSANKYGLDPVRYAELINFESGGDPKAVSSVGALGLVQIYLPAHPNVTRAQALNPAFALDWGARFFSGLLQKYGSYDAAYKQGYNPGYAGPGPFGGGGGGGSYTPPSTGGSSADQVTVPNQSPVSYQQAPTEGPIYTPNSPPMEGAPMPQLPGSAQAAPHDFLAEWRGIASQPFVSPETRKFAGY